MKKLKVGVPEWWCHTHTTTTQHGCVCVCGGVFVCLCLCVSAGVCVFVCVLQEAAGQMLVGPSEEEELQRSVLI